MVGWLVGWLVDLPISLLVRWSGIQAATHVDRQKASQPANGPVSQPVNN